MTHAASISTRTDSPQAIHRLDDLAEIIRAYNQVTENLRQSHESLAAEVVRLQERLASADAQLQRSRRLAALGEMAAGIAHEIRNPLGAISLYAGMLASDLESLSRDQRDEWSAPDAAPALDRGAVVLGSLDMARKIAAAVRGLDAIVSDVLSFARDLRPRLAPVRVADLLERALAASHPALDAAGVGVCRADMASDAGDATIDADADLIHQALLNVIRNAIEAMGGAGAAPPLVTVSTRSAGDAAVEVAVEDSGPGIAPADLEHVFDPFFSTKPDGMGMGLSISRSIVEAHDGRLSVRPNRGPGVTFSFTLPTAAREMAA